MTMKNISSEKTKRATKKDVVKKNSVARRSTATQADDLSTPEGRKKAWQREQKEVTAVRHAQFEKMAVQNEEELGKSERNPLLDLPEEQRAKLFMWLRICPYDDAVQQVLKDQGVEGVTRAHLDDFFQQEAESHWEKRIERATQEANALVQLVEKSPVSFSSGILAALGQEAFRQVASGEVEAEAMGKMTTLFLKARSDERAEQMMELRREKWGRDWRSQTERALDAFARELPQNPAALKAFQQLKNELLDETEHLEDTP